MHKEVRWYCAVSALAILTLPGAAIARGADEPAGAAAALSGEPQDAAPQATQTDIATADQSSQGSEIVVTGIRSSLERAAEVKQNSVQVVDSIVAQDISKFPDPTVASSLQRVAGVQVSNDNQDRKSTGLNSSH